MWYSSQPKQKPVPQQSAPEAKPLKQLVGENSTEVKQTPSVRYCCCYLRCYFHHDHVTFGLCKS